MISAIYFDGQTTLANMALCQVSIAGISVALDGRTLLLNPKECQIGEQLGLKHLQIQLPKSVGGGLLLLPVNEETEQFVQQLGLRKTYFERVAMYGFLALLSVVALAVIILSAYFWGIPTVGDGIAARLPNKIKLEFQDSAYTALRDNDKDYQASKIDANTQKRLEADLRRWHSQASKSKPHFQQDWQFKVFYSRLGANAMALPAGQLIFTDEIINLAPSNEALFGVLGHELGHVVHNHTLRGISRVVLLSALTSWLWGDFSSVLAFATDGISYLQYSREFETESDTHSLEMMKASGVSSQATALLFERMLIQREKKSQVKQVDSKLSLPDFLHTHPDLSGRIARFKYGE